MAERCRAGKLVFIFGTLNQIAEQLSFQEPIEYSSVDFKIAAFGVQLAWARVGLGVGSKYYNLNRNGTGGTQQAPSQRNRSILRSPGQTRFWNRHEGLQDLINGSGAGHQDLLEAISIIERPNKLSRDSAQTSRLEDRMRS